MTQADSCRRVAYGCRCPVPSWKGQKMERLKGAVRRPPKPYIALENGCATTQTMAAAAPLPDCTSFQHHIVYFSVILTLMLSVGLVGASGPEIQRKPAQRNAVGCAVSWSFGMFSRTLDSLFVGSSWFPLTNIMHQINGAGLLGTTMLRTILQRRAPFFWFCF